MTPQLFVLIYYWFVFSLSEE